MPSQASSLLRSCCHFWIGRSLSLLLLGVLPVGLAQTAWGQTGGTGAAPAAQPAGMRPVLKVGSQGMPVSEVQSILKLLGYYMGPVDGTYQDPTARAVAAFQQAAGLQPDGVVGAETWDRLLPATATQTASAPAATGGAASPGPAAGAAGFPTPTAAPAPASTPTAAPAPAGATPAPAVQPSSPTATPAASGPSAPALIDLPVLKAGLRGPAVERLQERLRALGFFNGAVDGVFGTETETAVKAAQRNFNLDPDGVVGAATWTAILR